MINGHLAPAVLPVNVEGCADHGVAVIVMTGCAAASGNLEDFAGDGVRCQRSGGQIAHVELAVRPEGALYAACSRRRQSGGRVTLVALGFAGSGFFRRCRLGCRLGLRFGCCLACWLGHGLGSRRLRIGLPGLLLSDRGRGLGRFGRLSRSFLLGPVHRKGLRRRLSGLEIQRGATIQECRAVLTRRTGAARTQQHDGQHEDGECFHDQSGLVGAGCDADDADAWPPCLQSK